MNRQNKRHEITEQEWISCKRYFNNECSYCGLAHEEHLRIFNQDLHREHVDDDGSNDLSNCIPSCKSCNSSKRTYELGEWYNEDNPNFRQERIDKIVKWLDDDYKQYINIK